jgi:hypothetical protein
MIRDRRAQSAVWGFLAMLVFIAIASGLVDLYRLFAARNWAYSVAQEAAMAGASRSRDWSAVATGGEIRLVEAIASHEAEQLVRAEMTARGISGYTIDIRVLPEPNGGSLAGYPPNPVRLGNVLGEWQSDEPAVGVYLEVPVDWLLLDRLDISVRTVRVFAAVGVAQ